MPTTLAKSSPPIPPKTTAIEARTNSDGGERETPPDQGDGADPGDGPRREERGEQARQGDKPRGERVNVRSRDPRPMVAI
ncbi:MAG: hypothetical protein V6Z86_09140 [Hyphomicrobiales bacterium]